VKAEQKRDKEYAALQMRHLGEAVQKSAEDVDLLRTQLGESEDRESLCRREVDLWKDRAGKSAVQEAHLGEKLQGVLESSQGALRRSEEEREQLRGELQRVHADNKRLEADLRRTEAALEDLKEHSTDKLIQARDQLLEVTAQYEQLRRAETENARMEAEAHFIASQTEADAALHSELESLRHQLEEREAAVERLRRELEEKRKELEEERMESDALRLRLRLHGASDGVGGSKPAGGAQFAPNRTLGQFQQQHQYVAPSPMFSEDMGPVSIPASPATSPMKQQPVVPRRGGPASSDEFNFKFGAGTDSPEMGRQGAGAGVAMLEPGDMENKRLKQVVKEVRCDECH
jgi:septal ring factor EnvC (AmiA/AmiB activator)